MKSSKFGPRLILRVHPKVRMQPIVTNYMFTHCIGAKRGEVLPLKKRSLTKADILLNKIKDGRFLQQPWSQDLRKMKFRR